MQEWFTWACSRDTGPSSASILEGSWNSQLSQSINHRDKQKTNNSHLGSSASSRLGLPQESYVSMEDVRLHILLSLLESERKGVDMIRR